MHKRNSTANNDVFQMFMDAILILSAYFTTHHVYETIRGAYSGLSHIWMYIIYCVVFILCMLLMRMYNITTFNYPDRVAKRTMIATLIAGACVCAVIFLSQQKAASRLFFLLFAIISYAFILTFRVIVRWMIRENIGNGCTHVLFVGDSDTCEQYKRYIGKTTMKVKIDRCVDLDDPLLKTEQEFEALLMECIFDEVVIVQSIKGSSEADVFSLLKICEDMGITVRLVLDIYSLSESHHFVSSIGTYPVLTYHSISFDKVQIFFKAIMDIVGSSIGLVVLSPIFLITSIAIKLESPGPVFFTQTRVGQNGKRFKIYKFRSMYKDAEERKDALMVQNKIKSGLMFKIDDDPRITRVGKFIRKTSIDELPQLLNVLKRDMSLVGTRPPTEDEVAKYRRYHRRRISIMPGITGMWQVNGRSSIIDFEEVVKLDKQYIEQWSLALDIKLMFKTVIAVFAHRDAS